MGLRRTVAFALTLALALAAAISDAQADVPADEAAAQALFDEAKRLMQADRWTEACPKLEESHRLAPGIGTKYNLGDCYEHVGRLASAWAAFMDVAGQTRAKGQRDREQLARDRAAALEPRLSRVVVLVPPASRTTGLVITRDGVVVGEAAWGVAVPVDPGAHVVAATADDRAPWQTTLTIEGEGRTERVVVPALPPTTTLPTTTPVTTTPVTLTPVTTPLPSDASGATQRTLAWVVGGAGVVGIGLGAFFGLHSLSKRDDAQAHCTGDACDPTGLTLRDRAIAAGNASTVAFAIGAVAIAGAVVLYATSPSGPQLRASVGPARVTVGLAW